MKNNLNDQERSQLNQHIVEAEKTTGAQIVLALIERSDTYSELPWKAFALGVSVSGLAVFILELLRPGWVAGTEVLFALAITMSGGAILALLSIYVPQFARLFLSAHRAEVEVHQRAENLFLSRELFSTRKRTGILLLVSLFERQVVILPDKGLHGRLSREALQGMIARMTAILALGEVAHALEDGLQRLQEILTTTASAESGQNELPDEIIEEKGV